MEYKGSGEEEYEKSYGYEYGANGLVGRTTDYDSSSYVRYDYDHGQRTTQITGGNLNDDGSDGTVNYRLSYGYDEKNNLSKRTYEAGPRSRYVSYEYNDQNRIDKIGMTSDAEFTYSYDSLGRAIRRQNKPLGSSSAAIINESYSYLKGANNSATSLIERIGTTGIKKEDEAGNLVNTDLSYKYDYDANGNITKIYQTVNGEDVLRQSYEYDAQNQLTRENNAVLNKTVIYRYTSGGNILAKIEYPYTTEATITSEPTNTISYAYSDSNWKDKLTAYDGQSITYDEIGNPLTYGDLSFTWEKGRRLSQITDGENTYSYTYNADGIRTSKIVKGVKIDYVLEGDRIVYQKHSTGEEIWYNYDAAGKLLGFHRRTAEGLTGNYYYIRNGQGDILGFHNQSGRVVVRYTYDAWGKVISITGSMAGTLGRMNPFRYRGYYYDEETELYYLNSRYYNPDWGRFLNADTVTDPTAWMNIYNLFIYCGNNPINRCDPSGHVSAISIINHAIGGLKWPGEIHHAVQNHIVGKYGYLPEQKFKKSTGGRGRADILDHNTGKVWGIKPKSTNHKRAVKQLDKYVNGKWLAAQEYGKEGLLLTRGDSTIESDSFKYGDFDVKYWYESEGIIRYSYEYSPNYSFEESPVGVWKH